MPTRPPAPPSPSRSSQALQRLTRLPRLLVPALVLGLTFAGLAAPAAVGVPCLLLVVAFVAWLGRLSWPALDQRGRMLRTLTVGLLLAAAVGRTVNAI